MFDLIERLYALMGLVESVYVSCAKHGITEGDKAWFNEKFDLAKRLRESFPGPRECGSWKRMVLSFEMQWNASACIEMCLAAVHDFDPEMTEFIGISLGYAEEDRLTRMSA